jgi:hypothetical protein
MWGKATLAMLVSSTSMNAASETAIAMIHGLPFGCQISCPKLAAAALIGPYIAFKETELATVPPREGMA